MSADWIKPGMYLRDNDRRMRHRGLLEVIEVGFPTIVAKAKYGPRVSINRSRIHTDGRPRKSGFDLISAETL